MLESRLKEEDYMLIKAKCFSMSMNQEEDHMLLMEDGVTW